MSPTPRDQQQTPSPQDLPVLTDPIDPATIVSADAVEAEQPAGQPDALSAYEALKNDAPVAPDLDSDEYKVTRSKESSETSESSGVSRGKKIAVALTGAAVLAVPAAANLLPTDSDSVTTTGSNTEQLQDEGDIADTATTTTEVVSDSAVSDMGETVAVATANPADGSVVVETIENNNDTPTETATVIEDSVEPELENNASVPSEIIQDVEGAEAYPGEISVGRAVSFAQFLMNNQQKTGIDPTVEAIDAETGTVTFSDPNGYSFTVTGRISMDEKVVILDDSMPMSGIGAITIIDAQGNQLTVKSSRDVNVKPGLSVSMNGQNPTTTNQELFPGALLDEESTKHQGALITADIDGYFDRTFRK